MKSVFSFLLLWLVLEVPAQTAAHLDADSTQVETGNPFVLHLSVVGVNMPDSLSFWPWRDILEPKNVLSQTPWTKQGNRLTSDLTMLFFDADTIVLAPLAITFQHGDTAMTNSLNLVIYPTPAPDDLNDMAPIKDIIREQILWTDYLPWVASVLGVLAVLGLFFWWYSRSKKSRALSRMIEQPPHELALKKLDVLARKALWRQGGVKAHCAELTFILREYLEKRFHVPALESTSEELLKHLSATDFPVELKNDLENVLMEADLAKFAKAIPAEDFYQYSMDFSNALITRTIPVIPVEEQTQDQLSNAGI